MTSMSSLDFILESAKSRFNTRELVAIYTNVIREISYLPSSLQIVNSSARSRDHIRLIYVGTEPVLQSTVRALFSDTLLAWDTIGTGHGDYIHPGDLVCTRQFMTPTYDEQVTKYYQLVRDTLVSILGVEVFTVAVGTI